MGSLLSFGTSRCASAAWMSPTTLTRTRIALPAGSDRRVLGLDHHEAVSTGTGLGRPQVGQFPCGGDRLGARLALEHLVDLAADLGDRRADRVGAAAVLDPHDARDACSVSGTRKAPPPTAISVTSPASIFIRSTCSSTISVARASTARTVAAGRWATRERRRGPAGRPPPRRRSRSASCRRRPAPPW